MRAHRRVSDADADLGEYRELKFFNFIFFLQRSTVGARLDVAAIFSSELRVTASLSLVAREFSRFVRFFYLKKNS